MYTIVDPKSGKHLGYLERYVSTEWGKGRWANRTIERVYWRARPFVQAAEITIHTRRREAIAAINAAHKNVVAGTRPDENENEGEPR